MEMHKHCGGPQSRLRVNYRWRTVLCYYRLWHMLYGFMSGQFYFVLQCVCASERESHKKRVRESGRQPRKLKSENRWLTCGLKFIISIVAVQGDMETLKSCLNNYDQKRSSVLWSDSFVQLTFDSLWDDTLGQVCGVPQIWMPDGKSWLCEKVKDNREYLVPTLFP